MRHPTSCTCGGRGRKGAATLLCGLCLLAATLPAGRGAVAGDLTGAGPRTNLHVTLWLTGIPGEREALSEIVFGFQRESRDVIVCLEWKDGELAEEWVRRWVGSYRNVAPDVTVMTELWAWEHRHELMRLPREMQSELRREFEPAVIARSGGPLRGVPWTVATPALYYRPDLLAEAGLSPPTSFDELVDCAEALADPPRRFGLGVPGVRRGGEELLYALALAYGAEPHRREDRREEVEQPEQQEGNAPVDATERALGLLVELQSRGALQPETMTWGELELVELFAQGRLGMVVGQPWTVQVLRNAARARDSADEGAAEGPPLEWDVVPLPVAEGGAGQVQVEWLVAFKDTDRPENALRFMRFMAATDRQRALCLLHSAPALVSLAEDLQDLPPWSGHVPALSGGLGVPLHTWRDLRPQLGEALVYALSGRLAPGEALRRARGEDEERPLDIY